METVATANASAASKEEFRQKLAEVDVMLRHMKSRDFSIQRAVAAEEHEEAQKCEYNGNSKGQRPMGGMELT